MDAHESIKKLFQLYVGKRFSKVGKALFGKWLRAEQDQEIKEHLLRQHWETVTGEISADTWEDWKRLRSQLDTSFPPEKANTADVVEICRCGDFVFGFCGWNLLDNGTTYVTPVG